MSENFLQTINKTNKTNSQLRSPKQASHLGHTTAETPGAATMAAAADVRMPHHADVCVRTRRRVRQDAPTCASGRADVCVRTRQAGFATLTKAAARSGARRHEPGIMDLERYSKYTHTNCMCVYLSLCVCIYGIWIFVSGCMMKLIMQFVTY